MTLKLYHVSPKYWGKHPVFEPRIPDSAFEGEAEIPRICLAPTVWECYMACSWDWFNKAFGDHGDYHVYEIETDRSIKAHKSVPDRERTRERWLLEPAVLHHVLKMPRLKTDYRVKGWHSDKYAKRILCDIINGEFYWALDEKRRRQSASVIAPLDLSTPLSTA